MTAHIHQEHLTPLGVFDAALSSVKRRGFSKKQNFNQKIVCALLGLTTFLLFFSFVGYFALVPSLIVLLIVRWKNLEVFHPKETLVFGTVWLYASVLSVFSILYGFLYKKVFCYVTVIRFFPKFPYNQQTVTETATYGEILKRDSFWKDKLPERVPSPNFLTIVRIFGAISLMFLRDIPTICFVIIAVILFLTDYFDGIIARTRDRETQFGKWADPIADWLLVFSVFLYLYQLYPEFGITYLHMILPQIIIALFFGISFIVSGKVDVPRPVVWGRIRFTLYALGVLAMLMGNIYVAQIFLILGIIFAYISFLSYTTRKYQETKNESVFNGLLRLCFYSWRIRYEFSQKNPAY